MNDARMTIRLPGETLLFAQGYARRSRISLSELVLRYFNRLREASEEIGGLPTAVREVAGIIPPDVDIEKMYHDYMTEKHL